MRTLHAFIIGTLSLLLAIPAVAMEPDPRGQPDDSFVLVTGVIEDVQDDGFDLNYGIGLIKVELDEVNPLDVPNRVGAIHLLPGDVVTVGGEVDEDFFAPTVIEATSVYHEDLQTYYFAETIDDDDTFTLVESPFVFPQVVVDGTVTRADDDEFVLDTGTSELVVDVDDMQYNPLDEEGYKVVDVGDFVSVTGVLEEDLFDDEVELKALALAEYY